MNPDDFRKIIKEELAPIKSVLGEHTEALGEQLKVLGEHTKVLGEHTKVLGEHTKKFESHSDKLDALAGELSDVHRLADATLDVIKGRYEKNKKEIDEIKDHLKMPKDPYFGESV